MIFVLGLEGAFNQEKALVGAISVIVKLREGSFLSLPPTRPRHRRLGLSETVTLALVRQRCCHGGHKSLQSQLPPVHCQSTPRWPPWRTSTAPTTTTTTSAGTR